MHKKPQIMVLKAKELLYILFFLILGIAIIIAIFCLLFPKDKTDKSSGLYTKGVYSSAITIDNCTMDVAVTVSANSIDDMKLVNCPDSIKTSYPLLINSFNDVRKKVLSSQSLDISYEQDYQYTYAFLLDAVSHALHQAQNP